MAKRKNMSLALCRNRAMWRKRAMAAEARVAELEAERPYKLLKCDEDTNGEWVPILEENKPVPQQCTLPTYGSECPEPGKPCEECDYYSSLAPSKQESS